MKMKGLKEITFIYDLRQNLYEMPLPPPWKSVEDTIDEGIWESKGKHKGGEYEAKE